MRPVDPPGAVAESPVPVGGSPARQALTALGLAAGPVVALGFTRFAYALLLPAMHERLHWSYAQAGGMNTANALGYIIGAGTAAFWARRLGNRAVALPTGPHAALLTAGQVRRLAPTLVWYVLFGAGYVSYMTFAVALLRAQGLGSSIVSVFFVVLGAASAVATLTVWGHLAGRLRGGHAPALVAALVFLGVLPVLLMTPGSAAALLSAVVFGASFMAGPTAATVIARRMLPAYGWTAGIAVLTVAFSLGQAVGPLVSGLLSDGQGGIARGLWLSAVLLVLAAVAALFPREHAPS